MGPQPRRQRHKTGHEQQQIDHGGKALPEGAAQAQPITQQGVRSTQTEKYSRYPRHRSYARPGVSSLKGLLT